MTEGGAPRRLGVCNPARFTGRDDVTADLGYYVTESHTPHQQVMNPDVAEEEQQKLNSVACHIKPHGADGAGFGGQDREKVAPPRALKRAEDSQVFDVARPERRRPERRTSIIRESLREENKKNEVDDREKVSFLDTLILNKKRTRDVIDALHHANLSSQAEHPLFKAIEEYERLKKLKKADDIQGLADDIIGYCAKREEEDVDVLPYKRTTI
jgi:hypothetical protein